MRQLEAMSAVARTNDRDMFALRESLIAARDQIDALKLENEDLREELSKLSKQPRASPDKIVALVDSVRNNPSLYFWG